MIELAGTAAFIVGNMSGIGEALARSLVTAGARIAVADVDEGRLRAVCEELAGGGGTAIAIPVPTMAPDSQHAARMRAEAELGPLTLHCDVTSVRPDMHVDGKHFVACSWVSRTASGITTFSLRARPLAGLAAMALLVPGSLTRRPTYSAGVARARLFGADRDRAIVEGNQDAAVGSGSDAEELANKIIAAASSRQMVIVTHREWHGSLPQTHGETIATLHPIEAGRGREVKAHPRITGAELMPA